MPSGRLARRCLLLALMLVPAAGAAGIDNPEGPFDTRLYLHLNGAQDMVMNPLAPPASHEADHRHGLLTHSVCASTPGQGFTGGMHHTWYAFVSPVPVRYGPQVQQAPDRGILADLHVDGPMSLRFYFSSGAPAPAVVPEVVLRATVREGDDVSVDHAAMDAGRIVAQGQTQPALLSPALSGHPHVSYHEAGGRHVYGFGVELPLQGNTTIPAEESFNLRIDLFIDEPYCDGGDYTMLETLSLHTSAELRPALEMPVRRPVSIERLAVSLQEDLLQFRADVAPVFGSADAIIRADAFNVTGPTRPQTVTSVSWGEEVPEQDGRLYPLPARHDGRLHALSSWAFEADDAASGEYNLRLEIATEGGAVAVAEVPFSLGSRTTTCSVLPTGEPTCAVHGEAGKRSPGAWAVAPVLAALVAIALRRP